MSDYTVGCIVRIGKGECVVTGMSKYGVDVEWSHGSFTYFTYAALKQVGAEVVKPQRVWQVEDTIANLVGGDVESFAVRIKDNEWAALFTGIVRGKTCTDAWATEQVEKNGWKVVTITEADDD